MRPRWKKNEFEQVEPKIGLLELWLTQLGLINSHLNSNQIKLQLKIDLQLSTLCQQNLENLEKQLESVRSQQCDQFTKKPNHLKIFNYSDPQRNPLNFYRGMLIESRKNNCRKSERRSKRDNNCRYSCLLQMFLHLIRILLRFISLFHSFSRKAFLRRKSNHTKA
jgi:hypothetical protein